VRWALTISIFWITTQVSGQVMGQLWLGPFGGELGSTAGSMQQSHGTAGTWRDETALVFDSVVFAGFTGQVVYHFHPTDRVIVSMSYVVDDSSATEQMEQLLVGRFGLADRRERLRTTHTLLSYALWQHDNSIWRLEQTLDMVMILSLVSIQ
jgi:hypothetical protein